MARFVREARAAASIGHPGIVQVFDLGTDEGLGVVFLAMEKLEGMELFDRIQSEHPLPVDLVVRIGIDLADAMAAAHANGIIHRDLKPQNVFLASQGRRRDEVKVLDFGIAKLIGHDMDITLTRSGQVMGSPLYMAPEQLEGSQELDARTDVYAMGAILFEALSGRPPLEAESYPELVYKMVTEAPPPLRGLRPDVPPALVAVVERAMSKDPSRRYADAGELMAALEAVAPQSGAPLPCIPSCEVDTDCPPSTICDLPLCVPGAR